MTAGEIIRRLDLKPLPGEGGWFRETYRTDSASAIYYLVTPDAFSALHRLPGDELFHFYAGDPVDMLQLRPDGSGGTVVLGPDLAAGMAPQIVVPGGVWQGTRLRAGGRWTLLGTTMTPAFDPRDFELGDREALIAAHPGFADAIRALTRP